MANEEHLELLKQRVNTWNLWRKVHPTSVPDLKGADLREANLRGMNLCNANLQRADLFAADLREADLRGADLSQAYLSMANLSEADLRGADLQRARFRGTILYMADLRGAGLHLALFIEANLSGANLHGAKIGGTTFGNVDLSTIRGLDAVIHQGPSTIGIDTLYRSQAHISEVFLRGAGIPDNFITYIKSLVGRPFEFYSCFISYSSKDQEFAERLHADLQNKGVRCWFAPEDIQGGRKLYEQIDQAIRLHERLLLILSAHSMQSEWVKTEIAKARQREVREKRQVLFPMRLVSFEALRDWECFDADTGKDSAREIREYFIPDFSNWKNHDAYQVAFQRLLHDLKADI
jgi:uncharacterized protein YjbI with pentapeptide repeats